MLNLLHECERANIGMWQIIMFHISWFTYFNTLGEGKKQTATSHPKISCIIQDLGKLKYRFSLAFYFFSYFTTAKLK